MSVKNIAVFGLYPDSTGVAEAVDAFKAAGFRSTDIAVLLPENSGSKDLGHETRRKVPEKTLVGAIIGAIIAGILGWLVAIGVVVIPDTGSVIAAGPVFAALGGIGTGAIVGAIIGAIVGLAELEYVARRYEGRVRRSGILVSVHCDNADWLRRAKQILKDTGASSISWNHEAKADFAVSERSLPRTPNTGNQVSDTGA
ncbi:MAG TPA: quinol:electron acceptor oxidoreductase subunit ActD [Bryobacteraceae bacterium]|nr:quinol:electron acceptor oxidoreductase subunit ActD [Bryobacteraceae bacterium]